MDLSKVTPQKPNISYKQAIKRKPKIGWHHKKKRIMNIVKIINEILNTLAKKLIFHF